jgi:putative copper export protein/methionine-rich copper-binding protein CopC
LAVLAGVALGLLPATAVAGASPPTAAGEVVVSFGEPVESAFLDVQVANADGRVIARSSSRDGTDPVLVRIPGVDRGEGPARLVWRALSQDGDVIRGEGPVSTGLGGLPRDAEFRPLVIIGRLLTIGAAVALLGLASLRLWVVAGVAREELRYPAWWRAWWWAAAAGGVGLLIAPVGHLRGLGAGLGDVDTLLAETRWGMAWIVQTAALAAAALAARAARGGDHLSSAAAGVLVAAPALALAAVAWAGHASGGNDRAIGIGADVLHGWATALWLGGLVGLMVLVVPTLRRLPDEARTKLGAHVVVRFSTMAVACVAVLVVTGVYRALAELSSLDDLVETAYGRVLTVKLAVFALMLAAGAYNRFVIHPRLERAAMGLDDTDRGAALALRRSVSAELVLAGCIMVAVAVLVSLPTPV